MGAAIMKDMPLDDIKRITTETLDTFVPVYTKSYALALIDKLKKEAEGGEGTKWQLRTPPVPKEPLKEGWITKQGAVQKNWKKRFFVATNAADNFQVYYFDKEEKKTDPKTKKGAIQTCGYRIKALKKEEEVEEFGKNAFTLKPYGRRRQWFLRCDTAADDAANAEDLKAWMGVFEYASQNARPPLNPDPVMATAFKDAYRITRWRLGVWGWYTYDRTEEEQLGAMIVDRCDSDCMGPVYAKIPRGRMERKIRSQVQDFLDNTVGSAVGGVWKGAVSGIESQKETIEGKAREVLGTLFEKEAELKNTIKEKILGIIQPPLDELTKPIMTPICNCLMGPLVAAYKELLFAFHRRMTKIIADGVEEAALKEFLRDIRYWWGVMYPALRQIYRAFREGYDDDEPETSKVSFKIKVNIGDIVDMLHGVSAWTIERQFEKHLRKHMSKAIFTFASDLEETKADPTATLNNTMKKFMNDAKIAITKDVQKIFKLVLMPPFKKTVDPLISGVLSPISDVIPEPMKMFLDPEKMASEILENVMLDVIDSAVEAGATDVLSMLDSVPSELGFA